MKKITMIAASIALAAASVVPAFAQVPTTGTTTPKITAGRVKTMPAKARPSIHATVKRAHVVKKAHVVKRAHVVKKAPHVVKKTIKRTLGKKIKAKNIPVTTPIVH